MLGLAALLLAVEAPAEPYPAVAVLDAFREACGELVTFDQVKARLGERQWQGLPETAGTPIDPLADYARREGGRMVREAGGTADGMLAFRRTVAGEEIYLLLSQITIHGRRVLGCRLYDVGEPRAITIAQAAQWLGRAPGAQSHGGDVMQGRWEPGLTAEQDSVELFHIPAGSPVLRMTQVAGIALKADRIFPVDPR